MLPTRKRNRLQGYDYSENGAYFITVCTKEKANLLGFIPVGAVSDRPPNNATNNENPTTVGAIIDRPPTQNYPNGTTILSSYGKILKTAIENIPSLYPMISVERYVIMPNHFHLLLLIQNERGRSMIAPTISTVIKQLKGFVTKQTNATLWQKSFHDHVVRSQKEFEEIWTYIDTNPLKWALDCFYNSK